MLHRLSFLPKLTIHHMYEGPANAQLVCSAAKDLGVSYFGCALPNSGVAPILPAYSKPRGIHNVSSQASNSIRRLIAYDCRMQGGRK